jgi:DNA-binding transcriptional regulator YiaG
MLKATKGGQQPTKRGQRLLLAAKEALGIAKGEIEPAALVVRAPSDIDVKAIRQALGLTQSEFASKYHFSVARIRDWEQGRSRPDAAMRAYLMNIATGDAAVHIEPARAKGIRRVRISARMIEAWSDTRHAQELLPLLLRRLIARTASVTKIAMPGADAVSTPGWDGIVDAAHPTPWVREGRSFWELGAGGQPDKKAEQDYRKRLKQTAADIRAIGTFVFVSSRKWSEKAQWAGNKRLSGEWKDVRAFDALDIEEWLELSPATSIWFGEQLGMSGSGLASLDEAWRTWSDQTDPPLTIGSLLTKRGEAEQKLLAAVSGQQKTIAVRADSVEEAVAFICACFLRDERKDLSARTLVVTREEGWRFVDANSEIDIVIVARPELARERAPNDDLKVFIPFAIAERGAFYRGRAASAAEEGAIVLDRLRSRDFEAALADLGIDQADAQRLSRLTSRSWTVFRRLRAKNDAIARPAWLEHSAARALSTVCLIGSWNGERAGDRAVVERIGDKPYDGIERDLRVLATLDDAPVMAIGSVWRAKSPLELLHLTGERITRAELERFFATTAAVLASPDPALELSEKDRWKAAIFKKVREESGIVFDSLCDSLIKLAVLGPDVDNLAVHGIATGVLALVRGLLDGADSERWLSLHAALGQLAEAAPLEFLAAVERSLRDPEPAVARLIRETAHSGSLGGRCWHANLLWALEILSWRPQTLPRVIDILVKLGKFPVVGNWGNTPANTLLSVFRSWLPQTAAPIEKRIGLLDRVIQLDAPAGWKLLSDIALRPNDTASPNARPKWRDDDAGAGDGATQGEMHQMLSAAGTRLIAMAEGNADRLVDLIQNLDQFDIDWRARIAELISQYSDVQRSDEDRALLREALRKYIAWHENYERPAPESIVSDAPALKELHRRLEPQNLGARYAWLFNETWIEGYEAQSQRLEQMRVDAVRKLRAAGGMHEIEQFIDRVGKPSVLGSALGGVFDDPQEAVDWITTQRARLELKERVGQTVWGLMTCALPDWREAVVTEITERALAAWSPVELINFYLACPNDTIIWGQLERVDEALRANYWARVAPQLWHNSTDELNELARRLLAAKRPRAAFVATMAFLDKLDPGLLLQMLDHIRLTQEDEVSFPDQWHLSRAFDRLESSGVVNQEKLGMLEFAYVPALRFSERGFRALNKWVTTNPEVFYQLLKAIYKRSRNEPPEAEPTEQERNFVSNAWTALRYCKRIPGQRDDGSIDKDELFRWAEAARKLCREGDRQEIGDQTIGQLLSHASDGIDGVWPTEGVRDLLEIEDGEQIRRGFCVGTLNSRGVTSRAYDAGGSQERELARKFARHAAALSETHPRLAAAVEMIQCHYEDEARREDLEAKLRIEES